MGDRATLDDTMKRELLVECHDNCKVEDGCHPYHKDCGWQKGVRYGLYPEWIIRNPPSLMVQS